MHVVRSFPRRWTVLGGLLLAAVGPHGCAGGRAAPLHAENGQPDSNKAAGSINPVSVSSTRQGASAFASTGPGLESLTFVTNADGTALAAALAPFLAEPLPFSAGTVAAWSANGLRMIAVPPEAVAEVVAALAAPGIGVQRQWLAQPLVFTEVVRGPERGPMTIAMDAERLPLSAGRFRILARAWLRPLEPGEGGADASLARPRAIMELELVPQHIGSARRSDLIDPTLRLSEPVLSAAADGLVFSRLLASGQLAAASTFGGGVGAADAAVQSRAIVIVAEQPGVDWRSLAAINSAPGATNPEATGAANPLDDQGADVPGVGQVSRASRGTASPERPAVSPRDVAASTRSPGPPPASRPQVAPPQQTAGPAGPPAFDVPTIGQAMLAMVPQGPTPAPLLRTGDSEPGTGRKRPTPRTVLVLIPWVPEQYRLIR